MHWEFRAGGRTVRAVRAVDTATHPDHRRTGVFSRLTRQALEALPADVALVFNTPNKASLPGYLKMGWRIAGRIPVAVRIRRPLGFLRGAASVRTASKPARRRPSVDAESAAEALDDPDVAALLGEPEPPAVRLTTPRSLGYLRWRYGSPPALDYHAVREERGGATHALAIFRVRPRGAVWEATVVELIGASDDADIGRRLLRRVAKASPVDHLACSFSAGAGSVRAARRSGFVRAPGGITLAVRPLASPHPDPNDMRSWALSLGDLEVF